MSFFKAPDGCRIFYKIIHSDAENPFLICLSGTMQTALQWVPLARKLADQYNILLYDGRAQGKSDLGTLPLGIDRHTTDLLALMRQLDIGSAHLLGLSHGAAIAMAFAAHYPEKASRLILCSIGGRATARSRAIVKTWFEILRCSHTEVLAWAALPMIFGHAYLEQHWQLMDETVHAIDIRNRRKSLTAHLEAMLDYPSPELFADRIDSSCLVITGSEDAMVTTETAERLAERLDATHHILEGIGHTVSVEAPQQLLALVQDFLQPQNRT